jgi:hypothetical protein
MPFDTIRGGVRGAAAVLAAVTLVSLARAAGPNAGAPGALPVPAPVPAQPQGGRGSAADRNRVFVQHVYQDVLGRQADPAALATFGAGLAQGMTRMQVAQAVLGSPEYAAVVVTALYGRLLHRQPDPAGLAAYVGVLQHGGTAEQVEAQLVASDEYAQRAGGGVLDAAYQDLLGRHADGAARAQVAQTIIASDEYAADVVTSLYVKYLRRQADAQALAAMRPLFRQGGSPLVSASLLGSDEYYARP